MIYAQELKGIEERYLSDDEMAAGIRTPMPTKVFSTEVSVTTNKTGGC